MAKRIILAYHSVDDQRARVSVPLKRFVRQMHLLRTGGVRCLTVSQLLADNGPSPAVALTFDDGFRSVHEIVLPFLNDLGYVATAFPIVAGLGKRTAWRNDEGELPTYDLMTANQLAELVTAGWEIGSHTMNHRCCVQRDAADLGRDLAESRDRLQDLLAVSVAGLAYPQGCHDDGAHRAAAENGYAWACTTVPGALSGTAGRYDLHRVTVGHSTFMARFVAAFIEPMQAVRRFYYSRQQGQYPHVHGIDVDTTAFI
jgi:peptidoglycan/xylan/chitin deacetylase (PgdA/CDA1 family)